MKISKKAIVHCALATFIAASTVPAAAHTATAVVVAHTSPEAELANILFRVLGIPVSVQEVTVLKTRNLGYGEIALAYNLAYASGRSVDDILIMRFDHKMGWGRIAKKLRVKLHGPADQSVIILREAKLDRDADDFNIFIKIDLDDDDRDDDDDDHDKGKGHKKHH